MTDYNTHPQERTAREVFADAQYLFTDGHGTAHYWSIINQAVVAVADDGSTDTLAFRADKTLSEYAEAVRSKRGLETEPRIAGSLPAEIAAAVEP